MVKDGRLCKAYVGVRGELEPVGVKVPRAFSVEEWGLLSPVERLEFVNRKKELVLSGLQSKLSSPVVSLIVDLQDLEARMVGLDLRDGEVLSKEYLDALKLKIELAKAIKVLVDKGVVRHEHVVRRLGDDEVLDVDFADVVDSVSGDVR